VSADPQPGAGAETSAPALTVAAVARRLGVAPATLRTWDRRYALGPSAHTAGAHRRYGPHDVARLEVMRRLTMEGVAPADAARVARDFHGPAPEEALAPPPDARVVSMRAESRAVRGLVNAASALDAGQTARVLSEAIHRRGVVWTWDHLAVPALVSVGARWEATGRGIEVEHLLSSCVATALTGAVESPRRPLNARPVLLAAADEEQHVLPLHALAAALAERHIATHLLGMRVPTAALFDAVRRTGPAVVFVWSRLEATGDPDALAALPAMRPPVAVVAGGPGWTSPLPPGVQRAHDLVEAVTTVIRAAA